ncbi:hypothetical protein IQ07DRAFT_560356 [Pyrenochaeta sp. DS3sAY3a]|nr:hypothetical protein IQ07DRAFT_560356 [Pyrenochaeta sp. DS3sAY3a]
MTSPAPIYTVRSASSIDEASALWWPLMKELGWNRAEDDAKTHYQVAQNGKNWLLLFPDSSPQAGGCVVAFTYPNGTGWVAFFIMNSSLRGQGLGRALWTEMENTFRANGTSVIGLDGVQEQVETYKRRGFEDCARIPLMHTGLDRAAYWTADALPSRIHAYGYATISNAQLTGFVYVRRCELGYRIGPLYAETYTQAKQLLHRAMNETAASNGSYIAEIFGPNSAGKRVFEELGWTYAGLDYHRMWLHGKVPEEQQQGGKGVAGMYAIFDACAG